MLTLAMTIELGLGLGYLSSSFERRANWRPFNDADNGAFPISKESGRDGLQFIFEPETLEGIQTTWIYSFQTIESTEFLTFLSISPHETG